MGASTKLYLNNSIDLDNLKEAIENHLKTKIEIRSCDKTSVGMYQFYFKYKTQRTMTIFTKSDLSTKNMIELHLGHNREAIKIMRIIANVFGGLLEKNDCGTGELEQINGMLNDNDGLAFFLKQAIIENRLKDNEDIKGLNNYMHEWCNSIERQENLKSKLFKQKEK